MIVLFWSRATRDLLKSLPRATPSSVHCRLTDSPASGAIIARLSAIGRWRAARPENRARPKHDNLRRIAVVAAPADMVLVVLPYGDGPPPIWSGIGMRTVSGVRALVSQCKRKPTGSTPRC